MKNKVKKSFACAGVQQYQLNNTMVNTYTPKMGDVGIFRIVEANSSYIVDPQGINRNIFDEDVVILAFGNRYATSQIEGYVPDAPVQECHLLGRGGVAGVVKSLNATMRNEPSKLELLGYATDEQGKVINTIRRAELDAFNPLSIRSKVILSIGSSMDSGKTTTAAFLCGGLSAAGCTTAYLKLTGTAFPKDARFVYDRGADFIADFTHFGYPSTFMCEKDELLDLYQSLVNLTQQAAAPDYIVVEIADGILQRETALLLRDARFMNTVHNVIFSCGDSLGVFSGLRMLEDMNIQPFAVSGLFTASELLIEEVENTIALPVLRLADLLSGRALDYLEAEAYEFAMQERA